MFYFDKSLLTNIQGSFSISQIASVLENPYTSKLRPIRVADSKSSLILIESIEIVSKVYARLTVTDTSKRMYLFVNCSESSFLKPNLESYDRMDDNIEFTLLNRNVVIIEEYYFKPISEMNSENGVRDKLYFFLDSDVVTTGDSNSDSNDSVIIMSSCSIVGHISIPKEHSANKRKRMCLDLKPHYTLSKLNSSINSSAWRTTVFIVDISKEKEFFIQGTTKKGNNILGLFRKYYILILIDLI